ncbi:ABC transporter ATP-binding protein [Rhodococcus sp. G-MC3]|uniref:ABC transporter ATP-binding protein n=1 Tax=Rhodococcus sp. G-MC3 TaxID=3046209 RepID=UPI0024B9902A|nr:ABC transporter ATP-binding protein [Rhodococcus sp. G-MC3]MDJ0393813.1 ABC transporter ATP-binding protein [Rhodococcus sp. G-MC3]
MRTATGEPGVHRTEAAPQPAQAPLGDHVIDVRGLRRRYGGPDGFEAVRGIDFHVDAGELYALLGTNGAGKTSTLEVIEGLSPSSDGSVRVLGMDPWTSRREVRPYMGIMLQSGGFPSNLTVRETAQMWSGTLAVSRPVDEALEMADVAHRADVVISQLSGGERRRLDLAIALLNRPRVLFLDEPTTGLDPESRRNLWSLITDLKNDGTAIVLTTHYLDEVESLADRLSIMHRGVIRVQGTPAEIVAGEPSTIKFATVDGVSEAVGTSASVHDSNGRTTVTTHDLQSTLTDLLDWARRSETSLAELDARSASLESVFLSFVDNDPGILDTPNPAQDGAMS